jgi:hypothetical protein
MVIATISVYREGTYLFATDSVCSIIALCTKRNPALSRVVLSSNTFQRWMSWPLNSVESSFEVWSLMHMPLILPVLLSRQDPVYHENIRYRYKLRVRTQGSTIKTIERLITKLLLASVYYIMVMQSVPKQLALPCAVASLLSCVVVALISEAAIQHLSILPVYMCAVMKESKQKKKLVLVDVAHLKAQSISKYLLVLIESVHDVPCYLFTCIINRVSL